MGAKQAILQQFSELWPLKRNSHCQNLVVQLLWIMFWFQQSAIIRLWCFCWQVCLTGLTITKGYREGFHSTVKLSSVPRIRLCYLGNHISAFTFIRTFLLFFFLLWWICSESQKVLMKMNKPKTTAINMETKSFTDTKRTV